MAWSKTDTNILVAGLATIKLKHVGDTGYATVPFHSTASVKFTPFMTEPDDYLRQIGVKGALRAEIQFRILATDVDNLIDKLATSYGRASQPHIKIDTIDGRYFYSEDIGTNGYFGCEWELVAEGGYDGGQRYVDVMMSRDLSEAEYETCISSTQVDGTTDADDLFYHLNQMTVIDIEPPVCTAFQFREASSSSWDDTIGGNFTDFSFRAKMTGPRDSYNRVRGNMITITYSLSCLQAGTELADLSNYNKRVNEVRFSFLTDYAELVSSSASGMAPPRFSWELNGHIDGTSIIKIEGAGSLPLSSWASVFTDGTPP